MINKNNKEIRLTLPKKQAEWLENTCNKAGITKSKYISWCLAKKAEEMIKILKFDKNTYTDDELEEILQIIKQKWIDE